MRTGLRVDVKDIKSDDFLSKVCINKKLDSLVNYIGCIITRSAKSNNTIEQRRECLKEVVNLELTLGT